MMLPTVALDDVELGPRPAFGLRRENRGLVCQRLDAIKKRQPPQWGWQVHYDATGVASSMSAVQVGCFA